MAQMMEQRCPPTEAAKALHISSIPHGPPLGRLDLYEKVMREQQGVIDTGKSAFLWVFGDTGQGKTRAVGAAMQDGPRCFGRMNFSGLTDTPDQLYAEIRRQVVPNGQGRRGRRGQGGRGGDDVAAIADHFDPDSGADDKFWMIVIDEADLLLLKNQREGGFGAPKRSSETARASLYYNLAEWVFGGGGPRMVLVAISNVKDIDRDDQTDSRVGMRMVHIHVAPYPPDTVESIVQRALQGPLLDWLVHPEALQFWVAWNCRRSSCDLRTILNGLRGMLDPTPPSRLTEKNWELCWVDKFVDKDGNIADEVPYYIVQKQLGGENLLLKSLRLVWLQRTFTSCVVSKLVVIRHCRHSDWQDAIAALPNFPRFVLSAMNDWVRVAGNSTTQPISFCDLLEKVNAKLTTSTHLTHEEMPTVCRDAAVLMLTKKGPVQLTHAEVHSSCVHLAAQGFVGIVPGRHSSAGRHCSVQFKDFVAYEVEAAFPAE